MLIIGPGELHQLFMADELARLVRERRNTLGADNFTIIIKAKHIRARIVLIQADGVVYRVTKQRFVINLSLPIQPVAGTRQFGKLRRRNHLPDFDFVRLTQVLKY